MIVLKSVKLATKSLQKHFRLLFLLQIPVGILVATQSLLEPYLESSPILALIFLLPLFSFVSSVCTALTYLVIQSELSGNHPNFKNFRNLSSTQMKQLALCSLLVSVFFGLGLAALILPGFYFLACYLFVPILVISDPNRKVSEYLAESKQVVSQDKKTLITTMLFVIIGFLVEIPISQFVALIARFTGAAIFIDSVFTMLFGMFFDCIVVFYFLAISRKESNEANC